MSGYDSGLYDDGFYDQDASPPTTTVASLAAAFIRTLAEVLAQASHVAVARITVLWPVPDGSVRRVFDLDQRVVLSGSVTADLRRDVRRSATLDLANVNGSLSPALSDSLFAQGSIVLLERGAVVDGIPVYVTLLTGFVTASSASMSGILSVTVESYLSACAQDVGEGFVLAAGTFLPDALHTLWDPVLPGVTWVIDETAASRALGSDIPVLATDSRLDVGLRLARVLGCVAYDDRIGRVIVAVRPDPSTQPTFRTMTEPLTLTRTVGLQPVNAQAVEATPGDSEPFYVYEEVDDPASPLHRSHIGLRTAPTIRSDTVADPAAARAMARSVLAARSLAQDTLTVENLPIHLDLDEGVVVARDEPVSGTSGRYLVEVVEYPMGLGDMRTTESSVVPLYLADLA